MKIGSLFSGYGGLDTGVRMVLGGEVAWHCENDPSAAAVLAHHWPDLPNHGDITTVDWAAVEPVDVLTGGFPCQDVSVAGLRGGLSTGNRSGLWSQMAYAIAQLRPELVVIENVRGLLSARSDSDLEPCPWCLGDPPRRPSLRALGAVLGDLADLGYDAAWCCLRASDVGAPHRRERVFVLASPSADAPGPRRNDAQDAGAGRHGEIPWGGRGEPQRGGGERPAGAADADGTGLALRAVEPDASERATVERGGDQPPTYSDGDALREQPVPERGCCGASITGIANPAADTTSDGRHERRAEPARLLGRPDAPQCCAASAHADGDERERGRDEQPGGTAAAGGADDPWGVWGPAIERWEWVLRRPAPVPRIPGKRNPQLNPAFVEWLMGLPEGHVTDVPDLTRNKQLRILGNGVVPLQAAAAVLYLLQMQEA